MDYQRYNFSSIILNLIWVLVTQSQNIYGSITLTVSPSSDVELNQTVTLQCSFESNPIAALFYSSRNPTSSFCALESSGGVCKQSVCSSNYITSCPDDTTYSVQYPVPQSWNGATVFCTGLLTGNERSTNITFSVTVLVTSVTLTPSQITVDVSKQTTLTCQTDYCNPAAIITWYKSSTVISSQVTSTTDSNSDGFHRTTSILTYTGVAVDNGQQVYCRASNRQGQQVESNRGLLNVKHPPSSDPVITASPPGLQYDSGTRVNLTCQLSGGNPIATLSWRCKGVDMTGINQSNSYTAVSVLSLVMDSSYNNRQCTCTANHRLLSTPKSTSVTLVVNVLVTSVTLTPVHITVDVSKQLTLTCRTDYCNPAANITWYKSSTVISSQITSKATITDSYSNGLHRTTSVLTCIGVVGDNGQQVYCRASNIQGQQVESNRGLLNIRYPPSTDPVITVSPPGLQYDNGTRVSLTCQLSGGNPIVTLSWRCKGVGMTETNQSNSTTAVSVLSLVLDSSYNNRQCTCTANHRLLTSTKSDSVLLTVFYNNVITSNLNAEYVISEHGRLQIHCDVVGNPLSTITWLFVQNNTVVKNESNVSSSSLDITSANCLDHGSYKVTAENGKGPAAVRTYRVAVRCKPRLYEIDSQTSEKLGIGNNESLQIFVKFLLYPPGTQTQWKFTGKNNQSNVIENNKDGYRVTDTKGEIKQNVTLYKSSVNVEEFGSYTITVQNDVGTFSRIYHVDSARRPSLPANVTLICDNPSHVELSWISNFNGGDSQTFKISYSTAGESSYKDLEIISDKGYGILHSYTPSIELQGAVWFTVTASNLFGKSTSDAVNCIIIKIEEKASHQTETVVGSVVSSVAFIVAVTVLVIFLRRRYTCSCTCKIKMKIERIHENVKATDLSKDESQNSLAEQNVLGERSVYEELKERETGNQYQELSTKEKEESKTETYESIQRVSGDSKYEELSTVSKKQDQGDQTYYNSQTVTPTDVYVNTSFQN